MSVLAALLAALSLCGPGKLYADLPPASPRITLRSFAHALCEVESHCRYGARNATSGAIGAYQIMPASWAAWSHGATPTRAAQDRVALRKLAALHRWLGSWRNVAGWWLMGSAWDSWTPTERHYVQRVLRLAR
jgi:hypothetical protein